MSECKHALQPDSCALCKDTPDATPRVLEGPTIPSRFDGKCPGCGEFITEGEDIHLTDSGWVCTSCAQEAVRA